MLKLCALTEVEEDAQIMCPYRSGGGYQMCPYQSGGGCSNFVPLPKWRSEHIVFGLDHLWVSVTVILRDNYQSCKELRGQNI